MLPIRDENPTRGPAVATLLLILLNIVMFAAVSQRAGGTEQIPDGELRFSLEYAAIPCELTQGRPLSFGEAAATFARGDEEACTSSPSSPELFPDKNVWLAVLTSMFLHASWIHLGGNMLFLWIFGNNIEDHMGAVRYVGFYLLAGLAASLAHVVVAPDSTVPVVGASGAIAGVMGAYLLWFPRARILAVFFVFLIIPFRVPAAVLLAVWFVMQFFTAPDSGVAWVAHVGGFLFGTAVGAMVRFSPAWRRLLWRREYALTRPPGW